MTGVEDIQKAVGVGSAAFGGIAVLAPRLFLGLYGLPSDDSLRTMTRLWGTRTAALGALVFALEGADNRRKMMTIAAVMNVADSVMVAGAGGVPLRARVLGSLTSAGFAGAIGYALTQ